MKNNDRVENLLTRKELQIQLEKCNSAFAWSAGQGTGLGLSLSYDIVKAHGEELRVEAMVGEGSDFIFQIPIN